MKKKQIANLIMIAAILLIVAGGVLSVGHIRGWFDKATEDSVCLTRLQGTVNLERSGVIYPVENETVLRAGDKIATQPGASALICRGNDTVVLGGNLELTVTDPGTEQFVLTVAKGEVFVNSQQRVLLPFALGEATVENAIAALSVREGAQTVSVFRGTVGETNAGQATEYVGESVSVRAMKLESLNDFLVAQIRKTNQTTTLCYTNQELDDLEAKRQQAIQDILNGQDKPDTHAHSYTALVVEAGCTAGGYTEYTCACGDQYRAEETAALTHRWSPWSVEKPATAQAEGLLKRTCSNCQETEEKKIDRIDETHVHRYTTQVVEPTCAAEGYTVHTCACSHTTTSDAVPKKGHSYTAQVVNPTCETPLTKLRKNALT